MSFEIRNFKYKTNKSSIGLSDSLVLVEAIVIVVKLVVIVVELIVIVPLILIVSVLIAIIAIVCKVNWILNWRNVVILLIHHQSLCSSQIAELTANYNQRYQ